MLFRTFQAKEESQALSMVKAELGSDALIITTKKERHKGLMGFFRKPYYEVVAALEPHRPAVNPYVHNGIPKLGTTKEEFQNSDLASLARQIRGLQKKVDDLTQNGDKGNRSGIHLREQEPVFVSGEIGQNIKPVIFPVAGGGAQDHQSKVREQLEQLLIDGELELSAVAKKTSGTGSTAVLEKLTDELYGVSLAQHDVENLIAAIQEEADSGADIEELRDHLEMQLSRTVKCSGGIRSKKSGPKVMAFVGPTGVGKTTTIAKITALHAVKRQAKVAVITIDNYKIGAVEQIKKYCEMMEVPLEVVASPKELADAIRKHSDMNYVFIDTAGQSTKLKSVWGEELKGYLASYPGIEVCLCLSATTRSREIDKMVEIFSDLQLNKVIFTKLDETCSYGSIVSTSIKHNLPLFYLTTGQNVPDDLELATGRKVASLVLDSVRREHGQDC